MQLLAAVSDACISRLLIPTMERWGYQPVVVTSADDTVGELTSPGGPRLALLFLSSRITLDVCRIIRSQEGPKRAHLIVLSLGPGGPDAVEALSAGASDYISDSSFLTELAPRIEAGRRQLEWQDALLGQQDEMTAVCAGCQKVRSSEGSWEAIDVHLARAGKTCTHGLCPGCYDCLMEDVRRSSGEWRAPSAQTRQ